MPAAAERPASEPNPPGSLPGGSLFPGALLFLGIGCSGLGYLLWYAALEKLEAGQVAVFLYLEPLVTLAAAAAWLGEPVGLVTAIGGLVVLAGVSLVQRRA